MDTELLLIYILSTLVLALVSLLVYRYRREQKELSVISRMDLMEFAEFLRSNSVEGNIQAVAGKVSRLLIKSFGCERIVFLRKKRGFLDLNFYHGIRNFNRKDFHLKYDDSLGKKLSAEFLPVKIEKLKSFVPVEIYKHLVACGVDVYFPIFWRNNLYGIYFIKSNLEVRTPAFAMISAGVAQSLSAAYHIKWHESRLSNLEKKVGANERSSSKEKSMPLTESEPDLLPLIKIRDTNQLLPEIVNRLSKDLELERFSFAFDEQNQNNSSRLISQGVKPEEKSPDSEFLRALSDKIKGRGVQSIDKLIKANPEFSGWLGDLRESKLEFITEFSASQSKPGVLAFTGSKPLAELRAKLKSYRRMTSQLVENAEAYQQAELMSYTDALTELSNQRYMYKRLEEEINRAHRYMRPLAFIIFDIDELKNVNDTYGHLAGDALIRQVGQALKKSIRAIDVIARYGGDEFCVVMPEADEETCVKFMKRMIETIAQTEISLQGRDKPFHCSVSMGASLYPEHAKEARKLVHAADMALLEAKGQGRNRFLIYSLKGANSRA